MMNVNAIGTWSLCVLQFAVQTSFVLIFCLVLSQWAGTRTTSMSAAGGDYTIPKAREGPAQQVPSSVQRTQGHRRGTRARR